MPDPHCYASLQVCGLRVAALDVDGSPLVGAGNGYSSDALIDVDVALEYEDGDEFTVKNGCGAICQTFRDCDKLLRASVDLDLCVLDSELMALFVPGSRIFTDTGTGDTIGFELPATNAECGDGVALELWTKAWDGNSQALPPFLGGATPAYIRWIFPKVTGRMGDFTLENEILRVPVSLTAEANSGMDPAGPFGDWNVDVAAAGGITNVGGYFYDDGPPTAECGYIAVPAGS